MTFGHQSTVMVAWICLLVVDADLVDAVWAERMHFLLQDTAGSSVASGGFRDNGSHYFVTRHSAVSF